MKNTYTKKQITEAIRHWKSVLRKMNESNDSEYIHANYEYTEGEVRNMIMKFMNSNKDSKAIMIKDEGGSRALIDLYHVSDIYEKTISCNNKKFNCLVINANSDILGSIRQSQSLKSEKLRESSSEDKNLVNKAKENVEHIQNQIEAVEDNQMYAFDDPRIFLEKFNAFMKQDEEEFYKKYPEER